MCTLFNVTGKTIAHEFAHYRWGVFEEYSPDFKVQYYNDSRNEAKPVTCSSSITGKWIVPGKNLTTCDPKTSSPPCIFMPDEPSEEGASIMGYHKLDKVIISTI